SLSLTTRHQQRRASVINITIVLSAIGRRTDYLNTAFLQPSLEFLTACSNDHLIEQRSHRCSDHYRIIGINAIAYENKPRGTGCRRRSNQRTKIPLRPNFAERSPKTMLVKIDAIESPDALPENRRDAGCALGFGDQSELLGV